MIRHPCFIDTKGGGRNKQGSRIRMILVTTTSRMGGSIRRRCRIRSATDGYTIGLLL